jgi:DnaJ like chaperone protein
LGIFGKILGGITGFAMGGPFGAMLGMAMGHAADEGALGRGPFAAAGRMLPGGADLAAMLGNRETLFAISVIVLSAKLAKVDGPVRRAEIDAFKRSFRIPPENMHEVAQLFDRARDSAEGFEPFAQRLGQAFTDNKAMLEDVLGALFAIARADGPVNNAELAFLKQIHLAFGLDRLGWERAKEGRASSTGGGGGGGGSSSTRATEAEADAYMVLGVSRGASDDELRQAWRRLMRENHPDSLAARGVPEEFARRASKKVAEINAAWDRIKRERGL